MYYTLWQMIVGFNIVIVLAGFNILYLVMNDCGF